MSLFGINKWHIETSLDMMNAGDTPEQIEGRTREKLEDIKKCVEKELKEKLYKNHKYNIVIDENEWKDTFTKSSNEFEKLLLSWLDVYKNKIQKDTQSGVTDVRNDVNGGNKEASNLTNTGSQATSGLNKEKPEEEKLGSIIKLGENETLKINNTEVKKGQGVVYNLSESGIFTGRYKKGGDKVMEIEIKKDGKNGESMFLKVEDITGFIQKKNTEVPTVDEKDRLSKPPTPETVNPPQSKQSKENSNTLNKEISNTEQSLYSNYKNWRKVAKEIDSSFSGFTKTTEIIEEDRKKLKEAYIKVMEDIGKYLNLKNQGKLSQEKIEWVYQIINEISYFYADEHEFNYKNGIDNDHNKNYDLSIANSYIILNGLSTTDGIKRNLVSPPGIDDILKNLKGTPEGNLIIAHIKQGKELGEILSNGKIKGAFDKVYEDLYGNYEKQLSKEITWIDNKLKSGELLLSKQQIEAFELLKNIQGEGGITDFKSRNKENIFLMTKSVGAVGFGILAMMGGTALMATGVGVAPGSAIAIGGGALIGGAVTTVGMMFAQDRRYSLEEGAVEFGINSGMFFVGGILFKVGGVITAGRPLLSLRGIISITVQGVGDVAIGVSSDQIRSWYKGVPLNMIDSIKYNLIWALLPILMQGKGTFSQNRINLANKVKKDLERAQVLETMGDSKGARQIRDQVVAEADSLRKIEEPQVAPVKPKETINSTFSKEELVKIKSMSQEEYVEYLKKLPEEKFLKLIGGDGQIDTIYEAIIRRHEFRGESFLLEGELFKRFKKYVNKYRESINNISEKYNTGTMNESNILSIGRSDTWQHFEINSGVNGSKLKGYITFDLRKVPKITESEFESFLIKLKENGYNGQVKFANAERVIGSMDNIVFHGATPDDILKGEKIANEVFGNKISRLSKGEDVLGTSHNHNIATEISSYRRSQQNNTTNTQGNNNTNVYGESVPPVSNKLNLGKGNIPKSFGIIKKDLTSQVGNLKIGESITIGETSISKVKTGRKTYYEISKDSTQYTDINDVLNKINLSDLEKYALSQAKNKVLGLGTDVKILKKGDSRFEITKDEIVKIDNDGKRTRLITQEEKDIFIKENFDEIFRLTHGINFKIGFPKFIDKIKDIQIGEFIPDKLRNSLIGKKTKSGVDWSVNLGKSVGSFGKNVLVGKAGSLLYGRGNTGWLGGGVENLGRKGAILSGLYYGGMYFTDEEYQKYVNENPIETGIQVVGTAAELAYLGVLRTIIINDYILPKIDDLIFGEDGGIFDESAGAGTMRFAR